MCSQGASLYPLTSCRMFGCYMGGKVPTALFAGRVWYVSLVTMPLANAACRPCQVRVLSYHALSYRCLSGMCVCVCACVFI